MPYDAIANASKSADIAIVSVGRCSGEADDLKNEEGFYKLHAQEYTLIRNVAKNFKHTVLVLNTCGPLDLRAIEDCNIDSILYASMGGEQFGNSVVDIISGKVSTSGRLTTTWEKKYEDYPNKLFAGQTDIVDGKFEFTFMVPKDIRYNYGNGRIVYYAYDTETGEEGVGHFEDFVVGGSSSVEIIDTIGPDLRLYLNNPAFVDGDKTYEEPRFYAEIYDQNGINTVGSGIGHDLLLIIDDDPKNMHILNDYFTA